MIFPKSMAADALVTAIDGGRVVVFARPVGITAIMGELLREYPELVEVAKVRRVNGDSSLTFPGGGTVEFRTFQAIARYYRGACLDRVYVPIGTSPDVLMELRPALATSQDGTLTGY